MFRLWNAVLFLFVISIHVASASDIDDRLKAQLLALGFPNGTLPVLVPAFGNYVDSVQVGKLLYLSSAAPQTPAGTFVKGRVPDEVDVDDAITAAKFACVRQVNRMKAALGDLNRVKKIVYISGKIQTQPDFINHTVIVDGCSAFLVNVFGTEVGTHARTVAGMASLSLNVTLEVETIVEVKCK
ncbi:unnamed protein product [Adineta steineri]|uniref:Endoribonuclease L-PSP/chorismate mutase-like domain-containing protein n=2 Tax=Adineta steineri TaxID=433720 RepID=A0A814QIJ8_9BILA|nr:unnamed protein product [Adineta steineri]CAF1119886.1 unnamed protein product [Adineta steineri]CAF3709187.1 unnamed protein product [Adineta steineri]CAF3936404.1 unnamed protein product [Adineta steineri]